MRSLGPVHQKFNFAVIESSVEICADGNACTTGGPSFVKRVGRTFLPGRVFSFPASHQAVVTGFNCMTINPVQPIPLMDAIECPIKPHRGMEA